MAIGDVTDFVRRLRAVLPSRWFPDNAPVLTGMLTGFAAPWAYLYALLAYVVKNARIATTTGVFLDIVAQDFFQGRIIRNAGEPDTHFRIRILSEVLRPRATRASVDRALFDLTGVHPTIFEPADATDTGGYNVGGVGYNVAGGWGSLELPFQAFITAFRPAGSGIANVSGYGNLAVGIATTGGLGGYGVGAIEWADMEMVSGGITDDDIYATVAAALPAATIGWTRGLAASQAQLQQGLRPVGAFSRTMSSARSAVSLFAGALVTAIGYAKTFGSSTFGGVGTAGTSSAGQAVSSGKLGAAAFAIAASGSARTFGRQLYGSVVILGGRGTTRGVGKLTVATTGANATALGSAETYGKAIIDTQQATPSAPTNLTPSDATPTTMTLTWTPSTGAP